MKASRILLEMLLFFLAFFLPGYLAQAHTAAPARDHDPCDAPGHRHGPTAIPAHGLRGRRGKPAQARQMGTGALRRTGCAVDRGHCAWPASPSSRPFVALVLALRSLEQAADPGIPLGFAELRPDPRGAAVRAHRRYSEEFFFRSYLLGRMEELGTAAPPSPGLPPRSSSAPGTSTRDRWRIAVAAVLGTLLCVAYIRRPNLHVVAIAHGLYNTIVLCLSLPIFHALPAGQALHIFF